MKQRSRLSDATWTAFTEAIRFVVIPLVLVDLIARYYPQLDTAFMPDITMYILFFGGMITASSALEVSNKPGSYKRLLFGLSTLAFVCMWIFVILGGGIATFSFGPYFVRFDISKIVYIMLFAVSLKAMLVFSTFTSFRDSFEKQVRQAAAKPASKKASVKRKPAARSRQTGPTFDSMSKVDYDVTSDEGVGSASPSPPPEPEGAASLRVPAYKVCPICGAHSDVSEKVCRDCGAWF
ncbi:MAG: zinc ribbon domain-containing protein [Thermoplasmata archaeon]|nr:zinc ribbon domain-containing protein [Thermoplasmata archaeon]